MQTTSPSNETDLLISRTPHSRSLRKDTIESGNRRIARYVGEFWTSKQRQSSSLHEISYRACFKAQLPRFFIDLLTSPGNIVYDPFGGRGTTALEAALRSRRVVTNDVNPLSRILTEPRMHPPELSEIEERLRKLSIDPSARSDRTLSMFFHRKTEAEIVSLRRYLKRRNDRGLEDTVDRWIRMVATNRLTGHSPGFFSVYTLPPNQALSAVRQVKINRELGQKPAYRDVRALIVKKSRSLLRSVSPDDRRKLANAARTARFLTADARRTTRIGARSIDLTVTSPPFLNVVDYARDNWLRCWFNDIDADRVAAGITVARTLGDWNNSMKDVLRELYRITKSGGWLAFEVGEIRSGSLALDESIIPIGESAGFRCQALLINSQRFTKTANIWGIENNRKGTNTNRIVLFFKE